MYAGVVVESGPSAGLHEHALHPYTAALVAARPGSEDRPRPRTVPGRPVAAFETGPGCVFASRCPFAQDRCHTERPRPRAVGPRTVSCHRAEELQGRLTDTTDPAGATA